MAIVFVVNYDGEVIDHDGGQVMAVRGQDYYLLLLIVSTKYFPLDKLFETKMHTLSQVLCLVALSYSLPVPLGELSMPTVKKSAT